MNARACSVLVVMSDRAQHADRLRVHKVDSQSTSHHMRRGLRFIVHLLLLGAPVQAMASSGAPSRCYEKDAREFNERHRTHYYYYYYQGASRMSVRGVVLAARDSETFLAPKLAN